MNISYAFRSSDGHARMYRPFDACPEYTRMTKSSNNKTARKRFLLFNIHNLVLLSAFGSIERECIPFFLFHECRAERRKVRDFVFLHVRLGRADDFIRMLLLLSLFLYRYKIPE